MTSDLSLRNRKQLPPALRVLLEALPRDAWEDHPHYSRLIAFWLDRHLMFRTLMNELTSDATSVLDRAIEPLAYTERLVRLGGLFINELHGHHRIEDQHYFPVMATLDQRLSTGFELLDRDHHELDRLLTALTDSATTVLRVETANEAALRGAAGAFQDHLLTLTPLLHRHLEDEEDLVVPILLTYAPEQFR